MQSDRGGTHSKSCTRHLPDTCTSVWSVCHALQLKYMIIYYP